jgi:F-type H+-transporting ATPase subunit b
MQFDLFTFFASLFNFLVLLALLRIFLFKRVTQAMDAREERIASTWDDAEKSQQEADELRSEYERRMEEADEERDEMLANARAEIDRQKRARMEEARQEVDRKRQEWLASLRSDQERLRRAVRRQVAEATVASTRAALRSLAGFELERQMVDRLLAEIGERGDEIAALISGASVEVTTSHRLGGGERKRLEEGISAIAEPDSIEFNESDDLVCGLRLRVADRELGWSVADYLANLETGIDELIETRQS